VSAFDDARVRLADARAERDVAVEALARARERGDEAGVEEAAKMLRGASRVELAAFTDFAAFTDPRRNLEVLPDDLPFLLFGVRLETRFATVERGRRQLWVRIYPDTCTIDTFEPVLAETEVASARGYWQGVWRAGGSRTMSAAPGAGSSQATAPGGRRSSSIASDR
jgi:hypothetical protein